MGMPKTRIPVSLRHNVRQALICWRDYLATIGNEAGATCAQDTAKLLGLEPLPPDPQGRYFAERCRTSGLKRMLADFERYGPR